MKEIPFYIFESFVLVAVIATIVFCIYSLFEKERNAAIKSCMLVTLELLVFCIPFFLQLPFTVFLIIDILLLLFMLLVLLPFNNPKYIPQYSDKKIDERQIMFSRNLLKKGTARYREFYSEFPELKQSDDKFKLKPGLLNSESKYYNPFLFSASNATFKVVNQLQALVEQPMLYSEKIEINTEKTTVFIKNWIKGIGAASVGITELKPHHLYSAIGRGKDYGKNVNVNHKYAIVFTVEMDKENIKHAPLGPTIMESAQQYLNAGIVAVQVAEFIRNLGYEARAHIDANYRVICPLVAQDAGLGIIGRMGLLMTPELGSRVRIGVVTTDFPFRANKPIFDGSVISFCKICKKCAKVCPSKAISFNSQKIIDGVKRWQIDSESCFLYWCTIGTDCGRCISVCPYSHPNNFIHRLARIAIKRNSLNRWIAFHLDDLFYGQKPKPVSLKNWMVP